MGWAISGNNQTANILAAKFGWSEDETQFYNSLINVSSVVGMGIGSLSGGLIVPIGRRKTLLYFNAISIVFVGMQLYLNVFMIAAGKLLFGVCVGVINIAAPKMLDETVPSDHLGTFGIYTNLYICAGITICIVMGAGLPEH